ncbi:hypothetical protein B0H16DRAFT_391319 [Mycena metata]|uniref:Uncharacterized protein n=1 Tax=Mycena metata TaxID=1033252 RepID=A0AAD7MJF4_9AGAR|nr:hypothetical protein B0H16DRAFT_391319 [Mycena metata]
MSGRGSSAPRARNDHGRRTHRRPASASPRRAETDHVPAATVHTRDTFQHHRTPHTHHRASPATPFNRTLARSPTPVPSVHMPLNRTRDAAPTDAITPPPTHPIARRPSTRRDEDCQPHDWVSRCRAPLPDSPNRISALPGPAADTITPPTQASLHRRLAPRVPIARTSQTHRRGALNSRDADRVLPHQHIVPHRTTNTDPHPDTSSRVVSHLHHRAKHARPRPQDMNTCASAPGAAQGLSVSHLPHLITSHLPGLISQRRQRNDTGRKRTKTNLSTRRALRAMRVR